MKEYIELPVSHDRANTSLEAYVKTLVRVISSHKFDLIVGAANSGVALAYIAKHVYKLLKFPTPKIVFLPIFREEKIGFSVNHSRLKSDISKVLHKKKDSRYKVLFVDDEIGAGIAAHATVDLLLEILAEIQDNSARLEFSIIAEDLGFKSEYPKIAEIKFYPTLKHPLDGVYNTISGIIDQNIALEVARNFPNKKMLRSGIFNIVLDLPIKELIAENVPKLVMYKKSRELRLATSSIKRALMDEVAKIVQTCLC